MSVSSDNPHLSLVRNGAWCWFQDPRVIVDSKTGHVLFATVANQLGHDGERRNADIDVTRLSLVDGRFETTTVANIPTDNLGDDHNVAALWERPDGHYLAVYTGHNYGRGRNGKPHGSDKEPITFYRISERPHDASAWSEEYTFTWPKEDLVGGGWSSVTYSNLHYLAGEGGEKGRLYNIARGPGQLWQFATSDDWGETWEFGGILSRPPEGGRAYSNGYVKFSSNGLDRIDFLITEAHPRDFNNGLYHGYLQGGRSYNSEGTVVDAESYSLNASHPEAFTPVFAPQAVAPENDHTAWAIELSRAPDGRLVALFLTRNGVDVGPLHVTRPMPGTADHRLHYAELVDGRWKTLPVAKLGGGLLDTEEDYTGMAAIDKRDGTTLYVSTPVDPRDDSGLPHHELFSARPNRSANGTTWDWEAITSGSRQDNLRPLCTVLGDGRALLLWMHGKYEHQTQYNTDIFAQVLD